MFTVHARLGKISSLKITFLAIGAFFAVMVLCISGLLYFPDIFTNRYIKNKIIKTFTNAAPSYSMRIAHLHFNIVKNRIGFDTVAIVSKDSTFSGTVGKLSVSGVKWFQLLLGGKSAYTAFKNSAVTIQEITLTLRKSQYEFRCKQLHLSIPKSNISAEALEVYPFVNDDKFLSGSKFRKTRVRISLPKCKIESVDFNAILLGKAYFARSINIDGAFFDILVDMDKPYNKGNSKLLMPDEGLALIQQNMRIDTLNLYNAQLKYAERYFVGAPLAIVTFTSMRLSAEGLASRAASNACAHIWGQATFMKSGTMKIRMAVPIVSNAVPLRYSGSLDDMDLTKLNAFLETGENLRIKSGELQKSTFDIKVVGGRASGGVRALYKNLNIAVVDKSTRSEQGGINRIKSFAINTIKIRGTNAPDKTGKLIIGEVKYEQKPDDTFFQLLWFSLRSGVGSVVGF